MHRLRLRYGVALFAALLAATTAAGTRHTAAQDAVRTLPTHAEIGKVYPVRRSAANRAVRLEVINAALLENYATIAAAPGRKLLVLATRWENVIPWTLVADQGIPTAYAIPSLADHLYVVVDGCRVGRVAGDDQNLAGHVPVRDLTLAQVGDSVTGNVVFDVPAAPYATIELRFYDYAHGHFALPILEAEPGLIAGLAEKPQAALAGNEVLEAGAFSIEKVAEFNGQQAPTGMTFVIADLRAHSKFTYDTDATAFDPKAKAGDRTQVGTVADWTDAYDNVQLVLDGEYAYQPLRELSDLPEQPRFLPDVMTGGRLVFLAPAQFVSAEMRCDMANARTPGGEVIRPAGLTLALEGKRPDPLPERPATGSIDDDVFKVAVTGQSMPDEFSGAAAGPQRRWLVLDVTVSNANAESAETFQTPEQLKIADAAGQVLGMDEASFAGAHPAAKLLLVPPGERRSFQVAYRIPAELTQPRLAYSGVSKAEMINLSPLAATGAVAGGAAMAEANRPGAQPTPTVRADQPKEQPANEAPARPAPAAGAAAAGAAAAENSLKPLTVNGKEFPARIAARSALKPQGLAAAGLSAEQVNAAIDRGASALWQLLGKDLQQGTRVGGRREHVLMLLALVHARAHEKDSAIDAAVRQFLQDVDPYKTNETYQNALLCMLVDAYGDWQYLSKARAAAQWFIDSQGPQGTWGYAPWGRIAPDAAAPPKRRPLMVAGGEAPGAQAAPLVRQAPVEAGQDGDNSTTQYALLGLHAASRAGLQVPPAVWQKAAEGIRRRQDADDGGWAYVQPGNSYGSMTCAGICSLALAAFETGQDSTTSVEVERALAWLNANFEIAEHPADQGISYLYYYLYALERVGRILDTEFIGEHEWYPRGARFLIDKQLADGTWDNIQGSEPEEHASSFALLFLTRATPTLRSEPRSGPGRLLTSVYSPAGLRLHVILDCSGSMLEQMQGSSKFDIAREAVTALVRRLPAGSEVALQAYGHRRRAIEEGANTDTEILVRMSSLKGEAGRSELLTQIDALRARGKTPLAASLEMAGSAVGSASEERPVTVILLTDGGEDTFPPRDPVEAARRLMENKGVRLHVIGFDIKRADWLHQLQQMAAAGGGSYLPAAEAAALSRELSSVVLAAPDEFAVFDESNKRVAGGSFGSQHDLPPGKYRLTTDYAGGRFEQEFWISSATNTTITFDGQGALEAIGRGEVATTTRESPRAHLDNAPPTTSPAKRFCTNCGTAVTPGSRFCTSCGAPL